MEYKENKALIESTIPLNQLASSNTLKLPYLPSLDGLRAVSILVVIISHALVGHSNATIVKIFGSGHLGVLFFFVISGFLITTLLLREQEATGTISLMKFYKRRFLRIFPVAYLYLLVLLCLKLFFHWDIYLFGLLAPALYIQNLNMITNTDPLTGHFWSLGVEEQFYLIFPLLQKAARNNYGKVLIFCFILDLLLKFAHYNADIPAITFLWGLIDNIDAILIGCIVSILLYMDKIPMQLFTSQKILINCICVCVILASHYVRPEFMKNSIIAISFSIILISNLIPSGDFIFKLLNSRVMAKIGIMSYSLYIWQQLFSFGQFDIRIGRLNIMAFPFNLILLTLVAFVSYNYFEKYFLKLKQKFNYKLPALNSNQ